MGGISLVHRFSLRKIGFTLELEKVTVLIAKEPVSGESGQLSVTGLDFCIQTDMG